VPTAIYPSVQRHEITPQDFLIHSVLIAHAWGKDECSVGMERLALLAGSTVEGTKLSIESLIKARHIERAGHGFKLLTIYQRKPRPGQRTDEGRGADSLAK
jgi:hypothetical protein